MPDTRVPRLPRRVVAGYAAGSVGTGGFGVLPGLVLAYYLTDTLGVAALVASIVVVVPKAVDVIVNPVIGAISDRQARATGTRTRLMWIGAAAIAPTFVLTFAAPTSFGPAAAAVWVLVLFTAGALAYACFQVPYIALPAELTAGYDERTRLISVRIAVLALTILVVGAGAPAIRDAFDDAAVGYLAMAVTAALLIAAGMSVSTSLAATRARPLPTVADPRTHHRDAFTAFRTSTHYRVLLIVYVLQALASAVMLAGAQYLATYVLDDSGALTYLFAALVGPALLVMPVWMRVGTRYGKRAALLAASVLFGLAALGLTGAMVGSGPWIFALVALAGVGYAGMQTFPLAMLPDVIDEVSAARGRDQGGALSGLWTAGETFGLALGPGAYLLVLAATGFVSSTGDETHAQTDVAVAGIAAGFSLLPAVLIAVSILVLLRYERN
ncbi:MFS transporter [Gordonia humi]|uniref:Na+/melibiose symporter-like transporter n=1 Tax=Gordonia humi TaxID=686429 RepID=A0A840F6M7_9ACTN|nr:MFS transporter [Gordonia humi]MBB4135880.1 Na+/melibiose symporter-like transporter [Gordonia humi]